ncbi:hypothetical protein QQZ08_006779 [Neonectria magnoliae]|uniref:DUF6606 domain-containing protein n=1 Tax=Neonectria magnoliae TaxID=2732573 RepID=A0ABR1HZL8_9HYPO
MEDTGLRGNAGDAQMPDVGEELINYLFHHVFLPPQLPDEHDGSSHKDGCLIKLVLETLRLFLKKAHPSHGIAIEAAIRMVENLKTARHSDGGVQELGTQLVLEQISPPDASTAFHVEAQNAGVIIRKTTKSAIIEVFELSPTNQSVHSTCGRLVRQFPATAIAVPNELFEDKDFQSVLTKTLVNMSHHTDKEMKPKAKKAKRLHDEDRDTINPGVVTELLTGFLLGLGEQVDVPGVCKNTREEVIWNRSLLPWRRSPVWLLLRVSLQLTMTRVADDSGNAYKTFMTFFMSCILGVADPQTPGDMLHTMRTKISRRLLKLDHPKKGAWLKTTQNILSETSRRLDHRWQQIRENAETGIDLAAVSRLNMDEDLYINLPEMDQFISSMLRPVKIHCFPRPGPESQIQVVSADSLPSICPPSSGYMPFHLALVESWVAMNLDTWIAKHIHDEQTCQKLSLLIQDYHALGSAWYASRPESASRMHLVILELWIAADKAAIHILPMLRDYEPEIPFQVYQALLLRFRDDMARLARAEGYLRERNTFAEAQKRPSVFTSFGHLQCLPVRYFSESPKHQALMRNIENLATAQRKAKVSEFRTLKKTYTDLMQLYQKNECAYKDRKRTN